MAKYNKPVFVNELADNPKVKTASKFIAYKTWNDPSLWFAEVIDNGNAFFHWHQGDRAHGHKDSIINCITGLGEKWTAGRRRPAALLLTAGAAGRLGSDPNTSIQVSGPFFPLPRRY